MRRFPPLSRLRLILGASHPKTLPSSQNSNFVNQLRLSSPLEISPSHSSPFRSFINSFPVSSRALFSSSSSSSSSSPANIVTIGSEEGFNTALKKATDEKLPSIFYFTAVWCGPCRLLSPLVEQMGKELPHVSTYKLDIDQESLSDTLRKLQIFSVVRRYVYNDVVRLDDLQQLIDCSFIKPYTINSSKVIFLKSRPVSKPPCKSLRTICLSCDRNLLDLFRYCSLSCKVDHLIAQGFDVKRVLFKFDESKFRFGQFDGLQLDGSDALDDGDFDGGNMGNNVKESHDLSARAMHSSSSRRKGTPHRSPPS